MRIQKRKTKYNKIALLISHFSLLVLLTSCAATYTRQSQYPKIYEEHPVTLVVMPPINNTTNVEAKELLYTSISYPLVEAGYYVISPHLAMDLLKSESAYDAELFIDKDAAIFGRVFGADAVVFSIIDTWSKQGFGIATKIHYIIKSTTTNEILFERTCDLYLDLDHRDENNNNKSLLGSILDVAATAIATATTDHIVAARKCNAYIFQDIPRGKYSPDYQKDQETAASPKDTKVTVK
ncbi:MAG: GNA1162 family protein [bacterium]